MADSQSRIPSSATNLPLEDNVNRSKLSEYGLWKYRNGLPLAERISVSARYLELDSLKRLHEELTVLATAEQLSGTIRTPFTHSYKAISAEIEARRYGRIQRLHQMATTQQAP